MMDLIDRDAAIEEVDDIVASVSVCATVEQARGATWAKGRIRERLEKMPTIPAVPLDKLCELYEEINAEVPCVLCKKIMFEWCKQNNNLPLTWYEEWKCPTWKQLLTKWMEGLDAAD